MAFDARPREGEEGLQLLCTKYSSLISRLREEVLARQKAESDLRLLQRRLRDEVSLRESEERKWKEHKRNVQQREHEPLQVSHPREVWQSPEHKPTASAGLPNGTPMRSQHQEVIANHHMQRGRAAAEWAAPSRASPTHATGGTPPPQGPAGEACPVGQNLVREPVVGMGVPSSIAVHAGEQPLRSQAAPLLLEPSRSTTPVARQHDSPSPSPWVRQGEELSRLRQEHTDLGARHQEVCDELAARRDHLTKMRKTNTELEHKLDAAQRDLEEAHTRVRRLEEDTRLAMRSASVARAREASANSVAGRSERELKSREARLDSVRKEGRRLAQRAVSAERQLAKVEGYEATAQALSQANHELSMRLQAELYARDAARAEATRAEAAEAQAKESLAEVRMELQAKDAWARERHELATHLESKFAMLQGEMTRRDEVREDERSQSMTIQEKLRIELQTIREECEDLRQERDKIAGDSTQKARRLDKGSIHLAECKKRLAASEEALAHAHAELSEERKGREKCHLEAMRATERLRHARSQCSHLRERIRAFEAAELRYPSRYIAKQLDDTGPPLGTELLSDEDLDVTFEPLLSPKVADTCSTGARPTSHGRCPGLHFGTSGAPSDCIMAPKLGSPQGASSGILPGDDVKAIWNFVEQEEERLIDGIVAPAGSHTPGTVGADGIPISSSWEEPRRLLPQPARHFQEPASIREPVAIPSPAPCMPTKHAMVMEALPSAQPLAAMEVPSGHSHPDVAALLAAEPRVLRVPECCRTTLGPPARHDETPSHWTKPFVPAEFGGHC
mmetsp:Transcript_38649/g.70337  ORF Transcript_38649/g.70337 Transcript_38649/m.70337 type:complete len:795 (+) Transcript_38649:99-2483(+)